MTCSQKLRPRREKSALINKARWAGYATAAAATVVAGHETSEAAITYSGERNVLVKAQPTGEPMEPPVVGSDVYSLDLDGDTVVDFAFLHVAFTGTYATSGYALAFQGGDNMIAGFLGPLVGTGPYPQSFPYVLNLAGSTTISSGNPAFLPTPPGYGTLAFASGSAAGFPGYSQFLEPGTGFVGVKFESAAGTHFGWIRVDMSGAPENSLTVVDWAFGMPDEPIHVGAIPEPGSLGLLAVGAAGLLAWRRKRHQRAAEKAQAGS